MKMNRTEKITSEGTWKPKDLGHSDEAVDPPPVTPGTLTPGTFPFFCFSFCKILLLYVLQMIVKYFEEKTFQSRQQKWGVGIKCLVDNSPGEKFLHQIIKESLVMRVFVGKQHIVGMIDI